MTRRRVFFCRLGKKPGTRKRPINNNPKPVAGEGYVRFYVDGKLHRGQQLAWLYMTGEWPTFIIDHKDCNPANNRWDNLRAADRRVNRHNARANRNSKSGLKGVSWHKGSEKWIASVRVNKKLVHLGTFADKHVAHAAYVAAIPMYFGEFARAA